MSIRHWISQHAATTPNKTAIRFIQNSQSSNITYAALEQSIAHTTHYLKHSLRLEKGDRIAWYGMNHPDMLVLLFAAARCELILIPLNWRLALPEVRFIVKDCAPRALFFDYHFAAHVPQLLEAQTACKAIAIDQRASATYQQTTSDTPLSHTSVIMALNAEPPASHNKPDHSSGDNDASHTPLMIVYTSGTGGHPKGAVLDQKSFACNAKMSWHMHDMTKDDHILSFLPMFHVGGFNIQMLPALALGATTTLMEKFDPTDAIQVFNQGSISLSLAVPTMLQALLSHPQWQPEKLQTLRAMSTGSTDVPIALVQQLHSLNIPLLQVYGTTETSPLAIYQRPENAFSSEGSIGQCGLLCEIRLVDHEGHDVLDGENGEIWIKGDNILQCYWNNPDATQHTVIDGWFRSGDVARRDGKGFYWFADRLKHVIISGGENIYAAELERVIRDFPGLKELIIVGKPDPKWGEVAVVVAVRDPVDPRNDQQLSADVLNSFQGKLARYKHPKDVIFVQSLPRTALGKIQAEKVKALLN